MSDDEAVAAAMEEHGEEDARLAIAYAGLTAKFNGETGEATFWFGVFIRLQKKEHVGWA
ncbi:hypothetical protein IB270_07440 [Ensifer sp. ENS05]|uniref:hypothetical protein n=1 Tax=Ensifer sp. ENS05 TaxID=2769277 RepID=UPI001783A487|nr:hypothetical protein [Ensifer sp. ENS05]MBD9592662.1 hypothetical protein [Ensifer sp. ENS05]